jgi:hypothetical protein
MEQPLLKVIEKRRRPTDGVQVEEIIYLVPELCVLAGMTEEMRTNGQLRLGPPLPSLRTDYVGRS